MAKAFVKFILKHKETGEEKTIQFDTSKNPIQMIYRVNRAILDLKKYDKGYNLINVVSDQPLIQAMLSREIVRQEEKGGTILPDGVTEIPKEIKKKMKKVKKRFRL